MPRLIESSLGAQSFCWFYHEGLNLFSDKNSIDVITKNRMQHADFEVVKVIGRGAFGEVQLVSLHILHKKRAEFRRGAFRHTVTM